MKRNSQGLVAKVLMLALGAFMLLSVSAVTASAQNQDRDWRRNQQNQNRDQRRDEARRREEIRRQQEVQRQRVYTNNGYYGNNGYYNNGYGNNGYRNNGYGYNNNFTQTALNAGYNAGVQQGRRDRGRGYSDFRNSSAYRNADKDYNSRLGDRYTYQQYFRQGFENGYRDGVNGY